MWWEPFLYILSGLAALLLIGVPVAFAFLIVIVVGILILQGGGMAFQQIANSMYSSVASFTLVPIPLFILMGELLWHSKLAEKMLRTLDMLLGRVVGRQAVLTVFAGAVFSTLSGSTMANTAILGTMMLPDMDRRGYARSMSIGPIMASGGLAMMIPPSSLGVILASLGGMSISKILIGAMLPGLIMAALYIGYIVLRCKLQPGLAPPAEVHRPPWPEVLRACALYLLPVGLIVFLVTGLIVLGIATPTESAAMGCLGTVLIVAAYRALSREAMVAALRGTILVSAMCFAILVGAVGFSQILAFTGATRGLIDWVTGLPVAPIMVILVIMLAVLVLGTFMEQIAIMLITLPILVPVVVQLGFDPIWFGILMLINLQMALTTPPFGLLLFVMKGVAPPGTGMREIYTACIPFLICDAIVIGLVILFPGLVTWYG